MTEQPTALNLPPEDPLPPDIEKYFQICRDKLGMVPNVSGRLRLFGREAARLFHHVQRADAGRERREQAGAGDDRRRGVFGEQVLLLPRGAWGGGAPAVSGDPALGEAIAMNYRAAELTAKQKAMLDFAVLMTESSAKIEERDREALRAVGWTDRDIWDIAATASFFNMSNRMASAVDMRPNAEYHAQAR
jgi:hypothetical protein